MKKTFLLLIIVILISGFWHLAQALKCNSMLIQTKN